MGVTVFLQPVRLYDSGISGTSMFLSQITPHWLSLSVFLIVLNIPIFIFGAKRQGIEFTIYYGGDFNTLAGNMNISKNEAKTIYYNIKTTITIIKNRKFNKLSIRFQLIRNFHLFFCI